MNILSNLFQSRAKYIQNTKKIINFQVTPEKIPVLDYLFYWNTTEMETRARKWNNYEKF